MQHPRIIASGIALIMAAAVLAGCAAGSEEGVDAGSGTPDGSFPLVVEHAFGETVIATKPERVATVGWSNQEVPIALGIVPVGMPAVRWGDDDDDGILPWVEEKLEELGGAAPVLFDETEGLDFEAIADTAPDVILASNSGISQEEYDLLSKIAPVVAYPDAPWSISYQDMIRVNATAIGLPVEGDALVDELQDVVDAALAAHPGLADASVLFASVEPSDLSRIGYYVLPDSRPGFLAELGLPVPGIVSRAPAEATIDDTYATISSELADRFADVDLFVVYDDADGSLAQILQADPLLAKIPAIAEGRIAVLENSTPLAVAAQPSPLSIGWSIDEYLALLAEPLDRAVQ